jgi:hypothetical protein
MTEKTSYPLTWPSGWKRTMDPSRSRFGSYNKKPSVEKATSEILNELRLLIGINEDIILSTNIKLRNDGLPYSGQSEPKDTGVAVYFKYNNQDTVIACDSFDKVGCNIYAIALTIGAMRGIDRWGCSELMQRAFTGFKALPDSGSLTLNNWWNILGVESGSNIETVKTAYRRLAMKYHPDTGEEKNNDKFIQMKLAYETGMKTFKS